MLLEETSTTEYYRMKGSPILKYHGPKYSGKPSDPKNIILCGWNDQFTSHFELILKPCLTMATCPMDKVLEVKKTANIWTMFFGSLGLGEIFLSNSLSRGRKWVDAKPTNRQKSLWNKRWFGMNNSHRVTFIWVVIEEHHLIICYTFPFVSVSIDVFLPDPSKRRKKRKKMSVLC